MTIDVPEVGEIWWFFNGDGDGGGDYALITSLGPVCGIKLTGSPLLKLTRKTVTMHYGGFRYIHSNNTLTNKINAARRTWETLEDDDFKRRAGALLLELGRNAAAVEAAQQITCDDAYVNFS